MNAQTQITNLLTGSAARLLEMRGKADDVLNGGLWEYNEATAFFEWDDYTDRRHFCPNTKMLGAVLYGNDTGGVEAVITRAEAVARWGAEFVLGLEANSAERAS